MARPLKEGLDYFPLDVDFFEDDKIKLISVEFGVKAELVTIRLLSKIYKEGYFYKWGQDECLLFSKSIGISDCPVKYIQEVVKGLVRRCFFDKGCFDQFSVLTSSAIQRRYVTATLERKISFIDKPYWVLSSDETPKKEVNRPNNQVNRSNNQVNPPNNPQSKGDKRKRKIYPFVAPTLEVFKDYFIANGFPIELATRVFRGYGVANWYDSKGAEIKNWKQKCQQVWFKSENKVAPKNSTTIDTVVDNDETY